MAIIKGGVGWGENKRTSICIPHNTHWYATDKATVVLLQGRNFQSNQTKQHGTHPVLYQYSEVYYC